jgi:peptidoglycan L-alanyl-D-glutamate endopeptidase CwlK
VINSRNIDDLDPIPRGVCRDHIAACRDRGIEILVTSTYRDHESQEQLYQIGRVFADTRKIITNARGGGSWHNYRCAWDVVPLVDGKCVWRAHDPTWDKVVECGLAVGAEAGAHWKTFPDLPHFQVRPRVRESFIEFVEAAERFQIAGTIFIA